MPILPLLLLAAAQDSDLPPLPPSLKPGALEACAPTTLEQAETCLRTSLSPEDLRIVEDRIPARRFRPTLDMEISRAWKLADPAAPMAKVMDGLLDMHRADVAAGMIISDLQARAAGQSIDFKAMSRMLRDMPPDQPEGQPNTYTVPADSKSKETKDAS